MRRFARISELRLLIVCSATLIVIPATTVRAGEPLERNRFRAFIASITRCAEEISEVAGGECLKKAIQNQPESLKWISDPDRLVLLFQAAKMDDEANELIDGYRNILEKNAGVVFDQIQSILPNFSGSAQARKLSLGFGLPTLGLYLSSLNARQLDAIAAQINPQTLENAHVKFRELIAKIQPKKIADFASLFTSLSATTDESTARIQKLTDDLIENYFDSFTVGEKAHIISDYFRTPLEASPSEKLRPLLQNLDPVMQKIFQLVGRLIKDPIVEEATAILQSSLEPFPIEKMKAKVEERYGRPFEEIFENYDPKSIRRATTGQVLFADLITTKERVAIKVRIPQITEQFHASKKRLLGLKAVQTNPGLSQFVSGLLDVIATELDYRNEAEYTDIAQSLYTDAKRGVRPAIRIPTFKAEEDLVIYAFAKGVKPTKLLGGSDLEIRSRLIRNLIELWTETVFFKNIESMPEFYMTTLFHGDLHPENIVIDTATETLTVLDFGNVGLFPLSERREYLRLYLAALRENPDTILGIVRGFYIETKMSDSDARAVEKIADEVWKDPLLREIRLDSFLSRAMDEVGIPVRKSISSLLRGMAFLRIEAQQIDLLLDGSDWARKIPRVDFNRTMKTSLLNGVKKEFPGTLFGNSDETLLNRKLLGEAFGALMNSRFVQPCKNLLRSKQN